MQLVSRNRRLDLTQPAVMGIVNVTPDSFSDGGHHAEHGNALARALEMVEQGATVIDIGGESTRPGAEPVTAEAELARVRPVIESLRARSDVFISIDTTKPEVMRAACEAGADLINDVRALRAPGALQAAADSGAAVCLMHMQGAPRTMQQAPVYADVVADVRDFLRTRIAASEAAGIDRSRLCIDPGIGFGKTLDHNLELMRQLKVLADEGVALLIGVSRKSMFSKLFGDNDLASRINGSVMSAFWAASQGAQLVRTHDVRETVQALTLARALADNRAMGSTRQEG